jgi:hypothetical protein
LWPELVIQVHLLVLALLLVLVLRVYDACSVFSLLSALLSVLVLDSP